MKRRTFIRNSLAVGVSGALGTLVGCGLKSSEPQSPVTFTPWAAHALDQLGGKSVLYARLAILSRLGR